MALMHVGQYRACGSSNNVGAGELLVMGCCGHRGLAWVQKATREIHNKDMHGGLITTMMSILDQAFPEVTNFWGPDKSHAQVT